MTKVENSNKTDAFRQACGFLQDGCNCTHEKVLKKLEQISGLLKNAHNQDQVHQILSRYHKLDNPTVELASDGHSFTCIACAKGSNHCKFRTTVDQIGKK